MQYIILRLRTIFRALVKLETRIFRCTFVDSGISRIVDQLVNPRINTVLVPKVEDIVYSYLGIERPKVSTNDGILHF
jgi:hypothetical protein